MWSFMRITILLEPFLYAVVLKKKMLLADRQSSLCANNILLHYVRS